MTDAYDFHLCGKFLIVYTRAFLSLTSRLENKSHISAGSLVVVVFPSWRGFLTHLCSIVLFVRRHNVPAAAPAILGYVAIAALEYAGKLPLLLALLGGVTGHDDANDDAAYANENCVNPVIVHVHHTSLAVNFCPFGVVAFSGIPIIESVLSKLAAIAVEVLRPLNMVVLHIVYYFYNYNFN